MNRRLALQRLSALSAASLLPWNRLAFGSTASTLNALPRVALVIGNSRYREASLKNPANDAAAIGDNLKKMGFSVISQLDTGKAAIKPESTPLLNEVVAMLKSDASLKLSIEGHTDNVGDKRANLELSKKRAESVVKHLAGNGIDAKRLKFDGKGDSVPVADNRTEEGRAKNRRVELVKR